MPSDHQEFPKNPNAPLAYTILKPKSPTLCHKPTTKIPFVDMISSPIPLTPPTEVTLTPVQLAAQNNILTQTVARVTRDNTILQQRLHLLETKLSAQQKSSCSTSLSTHMDWVKDQAKLSDRQEQVNLIQWTNGMEKRTLDQVAPSLSPTSMRQQLSQLLRPLPLTKKASEFALDKLAEKKNSTAEIVLEPSNQINDQFPYKSNNNGSGSIMTRHQPLRRVGGAQRMEKLKRVDQQVSERSEASEP